LITKFNKAYRMPNI